MEFINRYKELLEKYTKGTISEVEIQELSELLNQDENHLEKEEAYKSIWNNTEKVNRSLSTEVLWNNLKSKIASKPDVIISTRFNSRKVLLNINYAAFIVITLLISFYFFKPYKALTKSQMPVYNEYSVPYGSKSKISLSDGTKIWLNSGSKIRYPSDFNQTNRIVYLEGEAFFHVAKNQKIPFYVKTGNINIKVYGTQFNVKSFKEEDNIETILISGSVDIEKTDNEGRVIENIEMKPNQIVTYSKNRGKFTLITNKVPRTEKKLIKRQPNAPHVTIEPVIDQDIEMAVSWKQNKLTFKSVDIDKLILKLQRWYNVEITLKNNKLKNSRFSGTFDNETIEQALDALKLTTPFSYTIKKNKITIY